MIARILLSALVIAGFSSCATYRTGQTPDDVYYSPARPAEEYVQVDRDEDNRTSYNNRTEDIRLRQQIRDPRLRNFDDDIYWNNPHMGMNSWNNSWGWNNPWMRTNNWGWNHGLGWSNPWGWNSPFICIPTTTSFIVIGGPARTNSTGVRYSSPIQRFNNNTGNGKGSYGNSGGGRYFSGSSNNNGNRSGSFFGGASNSNYNNNRSSGSGRFFGGGSNSGNSWNSGSSSSGGGRTFSSGGSSNSGGSSSGGGNKSSGATRKN